ncbi:MAG: porin family protein [Chitinophagales bacterium]
MRIQKFMCTVYFIITFNLLNAQYISVGPIISFGSSFISLGDDVDLVNVKFHPNWNGGVMLVYSTVSNLGFGADIIYSREGGSINEVVSGITLEKATDIDYVRVPLKVIWFFNEYGNPIRPKIFLGPQLAYMFKAETEGIDVKEDYNVFDVGIVAGGGANFKLAEAIWLNTDIHYYHGLVDITADDFADEINLNSNIGFSIGVAFGI